MTRLSGSPSLGHSYSWDLPNGNSSWHTEGTTFTTVYTGVDYAALVGGSAGGSTTAYLGFTASTGAVNSTQVISNLSYSTNLSTPQSISNAIVAAPGTSSAIQLGINSGSTSTGASIGALTISTGATVAITLPTGTSMRGVLFTSSLSIAGSGPAFTGKLDLGPNDLVISNGASMLNQISAMVGSGYNNGTWNGQGISSSAAANDSAYLTALGVILNDNGSGSPLYGSGGTISTTFDGSSPADGDVLVKYTYYGDALLTGSVTVADYIQIDNGFNSQGGANPLTDWYNGDFNYDGVINGDDYTLIDNAYNSQGNVSLASIPASPLKLVATDTSEIASSAVPEPATLGIIGIGAVGMLMRRSRRTWGR